MPAVDVIAKKRDGQGLDREEIEFFVMSLGGGRSKKGDRAPHR